MFFKLEVYFWWLMLVLMMINLMYWIFDSFVTAISRTKGLSARANSSFLKLYLL